MRFVCDGKAYDTNTMELVKLDDFATAIYVDHGIGEAFLQTWDDKIGVRISRMTDEDIGRLKDRFGWGVREAEGGGAAEAFARGGSGVGGGGGRG